MKTIIIISSITWYEFDKFWNIIDNKNDKRLYDLNDRMIIILNGTQFKDNWGAFSKKQILKALKTIVNSEKEFGILLHNLSADKLVNDLKIEMNNLKNIKFIDWYTTQQPRYNKAIIDRDNIEDKGPLLNNLRNSFKTENYSESFDTLWSHFDKHDDILEQKLEFLHNLLTKETIENAPSLLNIEGLDDKIELLRNNTNGCFNNNYINTLKEIRKMVLGN